MNPMEFGRGNLLGSGFLSEEEEELDRLAEAVHGGRDDVSEISAFSIASSQFFSTDKVEIARKLRKRIEELNPGVTVIVRNNRSITVELEGEQAEVKNTALRLTLQQLFPDLVVQDEALQIPWGALLDTQVRRIQRLFAESESTLLRAQEQRRALAEVTAQNASSRTQVPIDRDDRFIRSDLERPPGSSYSSAIFIEQATGRRWIGKAELRRTEEETEGIACKEIVASDIYAYYGANVPKTCLSRQELANTGLEEDTGRMAIHIMSELFENYHDYKDQRDFNGAFPNPLGNICREDGTLVREQGLGRILAIAHFINDFDVIAAGGNIGYQLLDGPEDSYAKSVKIDPGNAFFQSDPPIVVPDRHLHIGLQAVPNQIVFDTLPPHTKEEFILTLQAIVSSSELELARFFHRPGGERFLLHDGRTLRGLTDQLIAMQERIRREYAPELAESQARYRDLCQEEQVTLLQSLEENVNAADELILDEEAIAQAASHLQYVALERIQRDREQVARQVLRERQPMAADLEDPLAYTPIEVAENPAELFQLGMRYAEGDGLPQSDAEAIAHYRRAAEYNYANAQYELARCYEKGRGVLQSDEDAARYYTIAAAQGFVKAQLQIGLFYQEGRVVGKSLEEAFRYFKLAADQDDARAQYEAGACLMLGNGTIQLEV
ncbi:MAG: sel1 repeat family protein, partial [Simkaniaceae bacterium]|nr:sel1 repeat family protein [Simkaniaceae bacterium]